MDQDTNSNHSIGARDGEALPPWETPELIDLDCGLQSVARGRAPFPEDAIETES